MDVSRLVRVPLSSATLGARRRSLGRALREARHEFDSFRRSYPDFVLQRRGQLGAGDVPVFVFHSLDPGIFESQLEYLTLNGYRGVTLDEFLAITSGRSAGSGREVLLAVDDARSSIWRYGLPLLRRYRQHATLFVMTGWTPESAALHPNLDTPGETVGSLHAQDPEDLRICNWSEIRAMHESGYVDIQSHSHHHARCFVSTDILDVIGPAHGLNGHDCAGSSYVLRESEPWRIPADSFRGLPMFPDAAVCEGRPQLELDPAVAQAFRDSFSAFAASDGLSPGWPARFVDAVRTRVPELVFRRVDEDEAWQRVLAEMGTAREMLVSRLGSVATGRTFCIPFSEGSETTVRAARHLGLEAMFWSTLPGRPLNRAGQDPLRMSRIKNDFLHRLPGRGRYGLARIYADKVRRRLRGDAGY